MSSNNSSEPIDFSFEVNSYLAVNSSVLIFLALPGLVLNALVAVALAGKIAKKQGRSSVDYPSQHLHCWASHNPIIKCT